MNSDFAPHPESASSAQLRDLRCQLTAALDLLGGDMAATLLSPGALRQALAGKARDTAVQAVLELMRRHRQECFAAATARGSTERDAALAAGGAAACDSLMSELAQLVA